MKYSQIKQVKEFCENLASAPDWKEVLPDLINGSPDFEVDAVRFINTNDIDSILAEELSNDLYCLGCFNATFLSSILNIDADVIEAMQESEAYEAIGKLIISMDKLDELAEEYANADGYGHHFNRYDFGEEELTIGDATYHVFDNR